MVDKGKLLKYGILSVFWILCLCILIVFSGENSSNIYTKKVLAYSKFDIASNSLGPVRYVRHGSKKESRPSIYVYFDDLIFENNYLGIFRSALHQVAKIRNFNYSVSRYSNNSTKSFSGDSVSDGILKKDKDLMMHIEHHTQRLMDKKNEWGVNFYFKHGNVSELTINGFSYSTLVDNNSAFSIQSKRAIRSHVGHGLILRGHVIIRAGEASILESNNVVWDLDNDTLTVKGVYVLNRNGRRTTGKDITVDLNLKEIVPTDNLAHSGKGELKCFAKS